MLRQLQTPARSLFRPRARFVLALLAALAIVAFLGRQEGIRPGLLGTAIAQAQDQTGRELSVLPAEADVALPEMYSHIRPAAMNGEPPPIPAAEVWPAQ